MAIKGVVFDKDGTLFDFKATWGAWSGALLRQLSEGDPVLFDRLADVLGYLPDENGFRPDSIAIAATAGEIAVSLAPHLEGWTPEAVLDRMNAEAETSPVAEVVPLAAYLAELRARGLKLGVATNDAEGPCLANLRRAGIADSFDFIAGFDSGYGGKPEPGQLLGFLEHTGLAPAEVLMVGDSTHDMVAGRAAGMACVAVLTGIAQADELSPFADVVMADISGLLSWLE